MKTYLLIAAISLACSGSIFAQETKDEQTLANEKKFTPVVSIETQAAREKQDAKYAKEQKKFQKKQEQFDKQQQRFEKKQRNLTQAQNKFNREREKREKYQSKFDKEYEKHTKRMAQEKQSPEDIGRWDKRKIRLQKDIVKSTKRMEDADRKVSKLRK